MNFELPDELLLVQQTVREFVEDALIPLETEIPDPEELPDETRAHLERRVKEMGFWALSVPEEYGGGGLGQLGAIIVLEQVSRCVVGDIRDSRGFGGNPWPVLYELNQEQRDRFLGPIVEGSASDFFAVTEPGAGNDMNAISTRATLEGDQWAINGSKSFITGARTAQFGVVVAATDAGVGRERELSAFLVERDTPGFEIWGPHRTMGGARVYELTFTNCRVPTENLIGEPGDGRRLAAETLLQTRLRQGAYSLGLAQRALELAVKHAVERLTFGRRLIERGAIQEMISASSGDLRAARLCVYTAAHAADEGRIDQLAVARAKCLAAAVGSRVIDRAIQIHGGSGVMRDFVLERMYRDQRGLRITEGSEEVHKWVIARSLLRTSSREYVGQS
jgi:acyl-CoA dehydrogenase